MGKEELGQHIQEDLESEQSMGVFESLQNIPEMDKVTMVYTSTCVQLCRLQKSMRRSLCCLGFSSETRSIARIHRDYLEWTVNMESLTQLWWLLNYSFAC